MTPDEAVDVMAGWLDDTVTRPRHLREAVEVLLADRERLQQGMAEIAVICSQRGDPADAANESAKIARAALFGKARP